jgi:hypothetical protein
MEFIFGVRVPRKMTHLTTPASKLAGTPVIDDKTVAKIGPPVVVVR